MDRFQVTSDWLRARAADTPDAESLHFGGRAWTFGRLDKMVDQLCDALTSAGIDRDDHLGVLMSNSPTMVCCVFAAARLEAVLVPLNTRLTATELSWQIDRADCAHLLCTPPTEASARRAADDCIPVHTLPEEPSLFEQWLESRPRHAGRLQSAGTLDSIQAIVFTSGTTGHPKGAMITFSNHLWSAIGSAFRLGVEPDDRWLACLPLYHVGGLAILFRSCLYGTTVVLHDGYDTQAVLAALAGDSVSIASLIPTMLGWLLDAGLTNDTAPHLRLALLGGATTHPELATRARAVGIPVAVSYGLTEAASQVATLPPERVSDKPGSAGRALLFSKIVIVDEDGREVAPGETGEITVAGPTVMAGYYADPAATQVALGSGRLRTGDLGYVDGDGDLWVINRRSDLIVNGGENVYPAEVERVLREHPAVAAACVVGLPDAVWGQQVAAMVVLKNDDAATWDELQAYCREHLAGYKQPRVLVIAADLPRTGSGKIHRHKVVEMIAAEVERT
jgi:O-succinylbenzoic acid--CoA ligase